MLQLLRKGAASWVAKGLLGLLVISFGIWGIADVFRATGSQDVAVVGSQKITVEQFRNAYQLRMRDIAQQTGRPLSPAEAQAIGIGNSVLSQLVGEATLDSEANNLGLSVSDDLLATQIREDPVFRGPTGSFDRIRFQQLLRQNGLTEAGLLASERERSKREQFVDAMTGGLQPPMVLRDGLTRYLNETRSVDYVMVAPDSVGEVPEPDEQTLRTYFDERKGAFSAPEYRKITILELAPAALAATQTVSDDDVKATYESRKADFVTPEKRTIQQISFPNDADAAAAAQKLAAGTSFDDLAKEKNLSPADLALGTVTKAEMFDTAVADAAFALAPDAVSQPVKGNFSTVILRVTKIEPGEERPLAEVADQIRQELQLRRAADGVLDAHDKIEDARAGGETLTEIGPKFGLTARTIERIDRSGKDPDGNLVPAIPESAKVLDGAFQSDPGMDTEAVSTAGNGYVWFAVDDVFPARERTFEEAKADVLARWTETRRSQLAGEKATTLLDRLKAGEPIASVAAANGLQVKNAPSVSRTGSPPDIGRAAASAIFSVAANGGVGTASADEIGTRLVFVVTGTTSPAANPQTSEAATQRLQQGLAGDLGVQYLQGAQREVGVTYDRRNIDSVVGTPES